MKKVGNYRILHLLPMIILVGLSINLIVAAINGQIVLRLREICGLLLIVIAVLLFIKNLKLGIIFTGLTIICGVALLINLWPDRFYAFVGFGSLTVNFQPYFILLAILHFIISGKYYFGIGTSAYWKQIFQNNSSEAKEKSH